MRGALPKGRGKHQGVINLRRHGIFASPSNLAYPLAHSAEWVRIMSFKSETYTELLLTKMTTLYHMIESYTVSVTWKPSPVQSSTVVVDCPPAVANVRLQVQSSSLAFIFALLAGHSLHPPPLRKYVRVHSAYRDTMCVCVCVCVCGWVGGEGD